MVGRIIVNPEVALLTPREAAAVLRVDVKTVARWADQGRLRAVRVHPTAQRRYREAEVLALLRGEGGE